MLTEEEYRKIEAARKKWETDVLDPALKRFDVTECHNQYYTPLENKNFNYLEKVGLPGSFPFTGGIYPSVAPERVPSAGRGSELASGKGLVRAGGYRGYGTAEDMRDYYLMLASDGSKAGPNLAFDLPTQLGYDSDHPWARSGEMSTTLQRPLNNLSRSIIGGIASVFSGGDPQGGMGYPFDEPLGLGHSFEAWQLHNDAARIIEYEAKLSQVVDPLAGSYFVESLTDKVQEEAEELMSKVEEMGGSVGAIENGFMQKEIAKSAYQFYKEVERGERMIVGVNCFTGEHEIEVMPERVVPHPYDQERKATAERRQLANLKKVKKDRDNAKVEVCLKELKESTRDDSANMIPIILEAVKAYATIGEMCGVLREEWGEYSPSFQF